MSNTRRKVATAAAAVLYKIDPGALDHCQFGHVSAEPPHARLLELMGKKPLLDLGMRLGEGTGAVLAVPLLVAAARALTDVATIAEVTGG